MPLQSITACTLPRVPTSAARWPPAPAPHAATRFGSMFSVDACARSQSIAARRSSSCAGNGAAEAGRYATLATA